MCMRVNKHSPKRQGIKIKGARVNPSLRVHRPTPPPPPTKPENSPPPADRLRQADEIWFHRVEFRDATRGNSDASFDFVEDKQHPMPASHITHTLEITIIW